jgi:hypothetical protein
VYFFYMSADTDVSDIRVYIVSVGMAIFILVYSVQCFKHSADCYMYTLTAVRDKIKLSTVESCMC